MFYCMASLAGLFCFNCIRWRPSLTAVVPRAFTLEPNLAAAGVCAVTSEASTTGRSCLYKLWKGTTNCQESQAESSGTCCSLYKTLKRDRLASSLARLVGALPQGRPAATSRTGLLMGCTYNCFWKPWQVLLAKSQACATGIKRQSLMDLACAVTAPAQISAAADNTTVDLLTAASTIAASMQLSKSDELHPIQKLLWSSVGLSEATKPADLQKADVQSCLAAARAVCLQRVSWSALLL